MKKVVFLVVAVLLVSLVVIVGCTQPAAPGEVTKTVTSTATVTAGAGATATTTVTAPAKTVTVTAAAEEQEVIEWTMACSMPFPEPFGWWANPGVANNHVLHSSASRGWAEWIGYATDGRLKITTVEPNAIFPTSESIENIGGGTIEAAFTSTGWLAGTIPESYVICGMSMMWPDARYAYDCMYNYGVLAKARPVFESHNVYFEPVANSEIGGLITTFPCTDMASLKGKKIRFFGAHGVLMEALGASPVSLSYGDLYMAMKLGTVDGATTGALAIEDIKLKEVAMGMAVMELYGCTVNCQLYNMDALNALPDDIKAIIVRDTKYYNAGSTGLVEYIQQAYGLAAAKAEYGFQEWKWPADEVIQTRQIAKDTVWPEYGAKSAVSQELLDMIENYLVDVGLL